MRLIDADALDDILVDGEIKARKSRKYVLESAINTIRGNLTQMPTVESERKKGEWIRLDEYPNDVSVKCSECGVTLEDWMMGAFYNYCPNCGADMRGEEG